MLGKKPDDMIGIDPDLAVTFLLTFLLSLWSKQIFAVMIKNDILAATYPYAIFLIMGLNYRPVYFAVSNIYFYNEKKN